MSVDGKRLVESEGSVISQRRQVLASGVLFISLILEIGSRKVLGKHFFSQGLFGSEKEKKDWEDWLSTTIKEALHALPQDSSVATKTTQGVKGKQNISQSQDVVLCIKKGVQQLFRKKWGIDPIVQAEVTWQDGMAQKKSHHASTFSK